MSRFFLAVIFLLLVLWTFPIQNHIGSSNSQPVPATSLLTSAALPPGTNVPIVGESTPDRQQVETTIVVDPRNPNIIVAGAQDYRLRAIGGHRWHGFYRSSDGGQTWTQSLVPGFPGDTSSEGLSSPLHNFNTTSDPVLAFDRNGNVYYAGIAFNVISSTQTSGLAAFVTKYVNDGAVYFGTTLIPGSFSDDKPWVTVDTTGGPSDGNVYVAFDRVFNGIFTTVFTRSTNGGQTWSNPIATPSTGGNLPGMAVDASGNVYVSTEGITPSTANLIQVTKLTSGGGLIAGTVTASTFVQIPSPLPGGSFRTFTIPQMAADAFGVYVVWDDFRTGNASVLLARSTDGGATWTSPITVNDQAKGQHFFPTIAVAAGTVNLAWYDSRLNTAITMTSLDVFYAQSTNHGMSFSPNIRVTNVSFNPNIVLRTDAPNPNEPFMGDYNQIAASPTAAYLVWADNRNACDTVDPTFGCLDQDAFTATIPVQIPISVNSMSTLDTSRVVLNGTLLVNRLALSVSGNVTLRAFDTVSGAPTFTKTYAIVNLGMRQTVGSTSITRLVLNAAVLPYPLSFDETVQLQALVASVNSLLTRELDINGVGTVDITDVSTAALAFNTILGQPKYNPRADFDANGNVDIIDMGIIAAYFDAPAYH